MELMPHFEMKPFTRTLWVSQEAKDAWEPVLLEAERCYYQLELLTVGEGLRSVCTDHYRSEELIDRVAELGKHGLVFRPLRRVGDYKGFTHAHPAVEPGKPWTYYGAIGSAEDTEAFAQANADNDHEAIGQLLGYPECCRKFFTEVWGAGYHDPIWQAAERSDPDRIRSRSDPANPPLRFLKVEAYPEVLSLLRYIGIRLTPQIPCSSTCQESRERALEWISLGRKHDLEGLDSLLEILSWPMEWNCLHGIAEIRTPLFKVSTNSMPTLESYTVQVTGSSYPDLAPTGLTFPYHRPEGVMVTQSPAFMRAEEQISVD